MKEQFVRDANDHRGPARRETLRLGALLLASAPIAGAMLASRPARAAKVAQATAMYQPTPHGEQKCDGCIHFVPGKTPEAMGTCQVVDGAISPNGWCVLFAPKA